jgi:very-short-patch-repair endonuclease
VPLLGRFVADFYAQGHRLVVEVDGGYHERRAREDALRDAALERAGYRVLRLSAELVLRDPDMAIANIRLALANPTAPRHRCTKRGPTQDDQ